MPVARFSSSTVAPGIAAPVESKTVPTRLPSADWGKPVWVNTPSNNTHSSETPTRNFREGMTRPPNFLHPGGQCLVAYLKAICRRAPVNITTLCSNLTSQALLLTTPAPDLTNVRGHRPRLQSHEL